MSDLNSLMQVAPYAASWLIGDKFAQDKQTEQYRQQELAQIINTRAGQEARSQALHPLELQAKQLANQKGQLELPEVIAKGEQAQLTANKQKATQPAEIEDTNSKNNFALFSRAASQFPVIAKEISGIPGVDQPRALAEALRRRGFTGEFSNQLLQMFAQGVAPGTLPQALDSIGQQFLRSNPEYAKTMDQEREQSRSREQAARIAAEASRYNTDERVRAAVAGKPASDDFVARAMTEMKGKSPSVQFSTLNRYIALAMAANDTEAVQQLTAQAVAIKAQVDAALNAPRAGTPNMEALTEGRVPTNPAANLPIAGMPTPTPNPTAIPPGAIGMLKSNPGLAAAFDAKYGAGASARVLNSK